MMMQQELKEEARVQSAPIRYAVYARVSSKAQAASDKVSIADQLRDCHAWSQNQGLFKASPCEYIDDGITGETLEGRPAFVQMLKDAAAGNFDVLLVRFGDRISRTLKIHSAVYHDLTQAGVQIRDLSKNTSPVVDPATFRKRGSRGDLGGLIENTFSGLMAQIDQAQRVERMISGKRGAIEKGKYIWTKPPFGYKFVREMINSNGASIRVLIPNPETYHLLEELPRLILEKHMGDREIAAYWNKKGYRTASGAVWRGGNVLYLRTNRFYAGELSYGVNIPVRTTKGTISTMKNPDADAVLYAPHKYECPWTMEQFNAIRENKARRARSGGRSVASASPLVGTLRCGYCGHSMSFKSAKERHITPQKGNPYIINSTTYYYCSYNSATGGQCCRANGWRAKVVWQGVVMLLNTYFSDSIAEGLEITSSQTTIKEQIARLTQQLEVVRKNLSEGVERRRKRINYAYQTETINLDEYRLQLRELDEERTSLQSEAEHLEGEIIQAQDATIRVERTRTLRELWEEQKLTISQMGMDVRDWPKELIQALKFDLIQQVFKALYVRETDDALPRARNHRKGEVVLEPVYLL